MTETITLSNAINVSGVETRVLSMREPSVEDMLTIKKLAKVPEEQELSLFSNLCEVSPESIRALKWRDYRKLQKAFSKLVDEDFPLD